MYWEGDIGQPAANSISQIRGSSERRASGLESEIFVHLCRESRDKRYEVIR